MQTMLSADFELDNQPRLPEATQPAPPEEPLVYSFPWPIFILFVISMRAIVGIVKLIKRIARSEAVY